MPSIRKADPQELENIRTFYHQLTDACQRAHYDIGWKKDIYPSPELLKESLSAGELYIGLMNGRMASAMILNHECNDGYQDITWPAALPPASITLIHALGVHPEYAGQHIGRRMVEFAADKAKTAGQKALRLDVLKGNTPAEKLYTRFGFQSRGVVRMYYEDTGWTDYEVYEYLLS